MSEASRVRRKVTPRFFVVLAIFFVTVYLVYGYAQGFLRMRSLRQQITEVQRQIEELEAQNRELERRLELYESDAFVERTAREELGLVRPGEVPVIVIDGADAADPDRFEPID